MIARILGAVWSDKYYCPFCSYTSSTGEDMGSHILSSHPKGR